MHIKKTIQQRLRHRLRPNPGVDVATLSGQPAIRPELALLRMLEEGEPPWADPPVLLRARMEER